MNFEKLFGKTCEKLGYNPEQYNVWLTFLDPDKMQELNARTRGINSPTDVLSYPLEMKVKSNKIELGDIIICKKIAGKRKMPIDFLYIHGLLHLFGYDHPTSADEEKMNILAEEILYE